MSDKETVSITVREYKELRETVSALHEVMDWIAGCGAPFIYDSEWFATKQRIDDTLNALRAIYKEQTQ